MENAVELPISLGAATLNIFLALVCGGLIGSERQVRQRMAGLRTNALVALGAASFVVFSGLFPDELSPTRVGAQVVSGIGFLGAGIIFRHGFTVHGLNTAATLWCSASVGLLAGASAPLFAVMATGLIIFVNLGLRPLVKLIKSKTNAGVPLTIDARVIVTCKAKHEADVRALVLSRLVPPIFDLESIERMQPEEDKGPVTLHISVAVAGHADLTLRKALEPLFLDIKVSNISWEVSAET